MKNDLRSELENLSDTELHEKTIQTAKNEQETTISLLYHLHEVERRKLYAQRGYGSLWDYVRNALHYSETQTAERISAMKLMFRNEETKNAIETGALSLTQAAMTERFLRAEEKEKQTSASPSKIKTLIAQVAGKSKRETEKIILSYRPREEPLEKIRPVTENLSEVRFSVSDETHQAMERFWELKGRGSISEMFACCLTFYLQQKDPLRKEQNNKIKPRTLPAKFKKPSRYISVSVKQEVQRRSEERCEYVDPEMNRRCESRYLLQFDHKLPYAFGGTSDLENIRRLCAVHNGFLAEKMFAREPCEKYRGLGA